jgi:hypothetical protein
MRPSCNGSAKATFTNKALFSNNFITRIFDPCAMQVKNPFTQIEYELFFTMFFMIFCMSDWDWAKWSPSQTCTLNINLIWIWIVFYNVFHDFLYVWLGLHFAQPQSDLYIRY